jgi:glycine cleavage system H protein
MNIPADLSYTEDHEWVRFDGETAVIGITDYAQDSLGDVVYIELPEVGTTLDQGRTFGVVESVKAASDLFAPLSGEVIEINPALEGQPELVNSDPYGEGWMVRVRVSMPDEKAKLLDPARYREITG